MSGHSKWATIKHKKSALDAKKGKIFTKLVKEISVAVKEGNSGDPAVNPRLRLAIQNAKSYNMPKENIERAIKKSADKSESFEEMVYEGYGPHGIPLVVTCSTNNTNRTLSNIKNILSKYGGNIGKKDSLSHIFSKKGAFIILLSKEEVIENITLSLIDAGLESIEPIESEEEDENQVYELMCVLHDFGHLQSKIEKLNIPIQESKMLWVPNTLTTLPNKQFSKVYKLIEKLEDDDDVQNIYHNLHISDEQMAILDK